LFLFLFCAWAGLFSFVLGLNKLLQIGKRHLPEHPVVAEPGIDRSERLRVQLVQAPPALAAFVHEMRAAQQAQVLRDGRARNGKGLSDSSGGQAAPAQEVQHGAAGGIGQRAECGLCGICNCTVTHNE
jgi:hypothetical protein